MSEQEKEENKSPEDNENECEPTSSAGISVENKEATEESIETVSHQSTETDVTVKANTVICIQGEAGTGHICFVDGVPNENILKELTEKQVLKYEKPRFWVYTTDEGWWSYVPSPWDYLPSPSDYLPWPFSSYEEVQTTSHSAQEAVKTAKKAAKTAKKEATSFFSSETEHGPPKGPRICKYGHIPTDTPLDYPNRDKDERNEILRPTFISLLCMILAVLLILIIMSLMPASVKAETKILSLGGLISAAICMAIIFVQFFGFCLFEYAHAFPVSYGFLAVTTLCWGWVVSVCTIFFMPNVIIGAGGNVFVVFLLCLGLSFTTMKFTLRLLFAGLLIFTLVVGILITFLMTNIMPDGFVWYKGIPLVIIGFFSTAAMLAEMLNVLHNGTFELGENEHAYLAFLMFTCYIDLTLKIVSVLFSKVGVKIFDRKPVVSE